MKERAGKRIYVDFAFIDKHTNITGIPRVAFEYLRWFYRIAPRHSVSVLPVYVRGDGIYDARTNLPDWVQKASPSAALASTTSL